MVRFGAYKALQELSPKRPRDVRVYKACLRSDSDRIFVIKTFPRKTHSKYAFKEFELLTRLEGIKGIVSACEIFEHDDLICVVEEYIEGICLNNYIKERTEISCKICGHIVKDLMVILKQMHNKGIVHRDIKPANIVLSGTNLSPILVDFDKGMTVESYKGKKTNVVGTPYYMAPELGLYYKKKWMVRDYDWKKADVWSFGVTSYLLLHGELPHQGISRLFDFSAVLLFLTKCAKSKNPRRYIAIATNCDMTVCLWINLALDCNWKTRAPFDELLQF